MEEEEEEEEEDDDEPVAEPAEVDAKGREEAEADVCRCSDGECGAP